MLAMRVELAVLTNAINLIDEDDRRFVLRSMPENLSHALCADTDENFSEITSMRAKEMCICFARYCFGQHRFARSRRADEEHAFRQVPSKTLVLLWVAQKIHDFLNFSFRFLDSGDVT